MQNWMRIAKMKCKVYKEEHKNPTSPSYARFVVNCQTN